MFGDRIILAEAPRPAAIRRNPRAPWLAVGVVCFGAFMGQLDASIVTLTFRPMQREFAAPLAGVQWVSLAYLLTLIALLAPAGRLADGIGRKLVYGYGFMVFTIGSAACGLAPALGLLVAFRMVQAAGAAMLQANSVALVTTSVPPARMRLALSIQAAAQSLGLCLGPTLGGLLSQTAGWRAVYWINVPVGCIAVVAGRYLLPRTRQFSRTDSFDWPGALLLAAASTALLVALSAAGGLPVPGWAVTALGAAAVAAGLLFAGRQRRAAFPLIPRALLRSARLALGLGGAFCGYLALFGPLVLVPQVLPEGGSELTAGLLLTALPAGFGVAALSAEAVLPHWMTDRQRGCAGAVTCALALGMLTGVPMSLAALAAFLALAGIGLGVFVPANNAVIMRSAAAGSAAVLGGLVNMARGIGTTFGIALVTLGLHLAPAGLAGRPDPTPAWAILAAAAAAAAVIAAVIRPLAGTARVAADPVARLPRKGARPVPSASARPAASQIADVISRLRRAMRRAARAGGEGGALPAGLAVAQLEFLSCLAENPGARPGQLARMLRLAPSSVATLVGGLLRENLVTRTGGTPDRRTAVLELTMAGQDAVAQWQDLNARIVRAAVAAMAPGGAAALSQALPALRELTAAVDALADTPVA